MEQLLKYIKRILMIFLMMCIGVTYFGVYFPLKTELEKKTIENFYLVSEANENLVNQFITRCVEGAKSISSRTMIKKQIVLYQDERITFEELVSYTEPLYLEGIFALDNIKSAKRIVNRQEVVGYGDKEKISLFEIREEDKVAFEIIQFKEDFFIRVYSPILNEEKVVGYDLLLFDLSTVIQKVYESNIHLLILDEKEAKEIRNNPIYQDQKEFLVRTEDTSGYLKKIESSNQYLFLEVDEWKLLHRIKSITKGYAISFLVIVIIFVALTNGLTVYVTRKVMRGIEKSRGEYKEIMEKDALTCAYSRTFFELMSKEGAFIPKVKEGVNLVVMVDIDNFKQINDTFGHAKGDEALIYTADVIKRKIREKDYIIRYGGDEFLIFLMGCTQDIGEKMMKSINDFLLHDKTFEIPLSISYGIVEIRNQDKLYQAIEEADNKMYLDKKGKINNRRYEIQ